MQEDKIHKDGSIKLVNLPAISTNGDGNPPFNPGLNNDRKRTKFGILKLAVRLFHPSNKPSKKKPKAIAAPPAPPAQWEKIVGSMRPLHLQENLQSPTASANESPRDFSSSSDISSPAPSFYSKKSGNGTISQYNSAVNLQDLDQPSSQYGSATNLQELDVPTSQYSSVNNLQGLVESEEEKDPDEVLDRLSCDEMIDHKAEEFIALFYQKMRLERSNRNQNYGGRQWVL